jgi:GNAT superfamily N-acetyltransferase
MVFNKNSLRILCDSMTERLLYAAGLVNIPEDIAENLAQLLPGQKIFEFQSVRDKITGTLTAYDPATGQESYRMKISFHPEKESIKLDTFYIVDPVQRGQGLGKVGLKNIYDLARSEGALTGIDLTATLDNGAYVWAKMGFKAHPGDFAKLQKTVRRKLHDLQEALPQDSKIDADIFGMVDDLMNSEKTKDPRALWALSDLAVKIPYSYKDGELVPAPKKLSFVLLEWTEYRGRLDLSDPQQVAPLEAALGTETPTAPKNTTPIILGHRHIDHDRKTPSLQIS